MQSWAAYFFFMSLCSCHYVSAVSLCYAVHIGDINIDITLYFAFA